MVHDTYFASTVDIHPESTGSDFIAPSIVNVYRDILGRNPDFDSGFAWTHQLRNGVTISQIRNTIADSQEARDVVSVYYQRILNRQPTNEERQDEIARLKGGASLKDIIRNLAVASCTIPTPTSSPAVVPGDANGDGHVNILDFNIVISYFGQSGTSIPGDVNSDGTVNILDFGLVVSNFGQ
jgi:hypothetical protein